MRSKFNAKRTEVDNIVFASKRESVRYLELKILERLKKINNLELQPKFPVELCGKKICSYIADFRYYEKESEKVVGGNVTTVWKEVVEDVKGMKTPVYRLKKKLVEALYGIEITEV